MDDLLAFAKNSPDASENTGQEQRYENAVNDLHPNDNRQHEVLEAEC